MADFDLGASFIPALHKPSALLPIAKHRDSLLYLIETNPVTIVVGQTGSGKTTQIPQFLEQAGWCEDGKLIAITQPRRVAATTVAIRVAEEFGCELGKEVGYSIRFEDVSSATTRIRFLTDGLLIREALADPLLSRYSVIMVDEAHERSISTDILLGLLKKIMKRRPELRIVISSATLQAEEFLRFFDSHESESEGSSSVGNETKPAGAIISLEGRTYPIDVLYLDSPAEDYVEKAVDTVLNIHTEEAEGDILVFLTGREEIDNAVQMISERAADLRPGTQSTLALPLYAGLSTEQQMYVFEEAPENTRKIIAAASQRAGRAGRTKPGKCFRLYTEDDYRALPDMNVPEIQRTNLAPFILQLKALGIDNVVRFNYLIPPPAELLSKATELLFSLGALDEYAKLTKPLGMRMAELVVEPMMAKTLLTASSFGCLGEILTIAAMTSLGGSVWVQRDGEKKQLESARRKFAAEEGDHLTLLNVYHTFVGKGKKESRFCHENSLNFKAMTRAVSIRAQLKRYLERFGIQLDESLKLSSPATSDQIRRCLTTGYFAHAARMQPDGSFQNVAGGTTLMRTQAH
ncbi:hypothetical protein PG994_001289 [Apiospora phragmitis]|uniref:RNA helicase n=1 Tax=Apiospora phragmitis TaxID=2905665 RepID=A0ABR1WT44_9PEZI